MIMNKLGLQLAIIVISGSTVGQIPPMGIPPGGGPLQPPTLPQTIPTKKLVPYAHLREADYVWSKRIWRTIDLREKMNYPLYYPLNKTIEQWSLWHILSEAILAQNITAYKPIDEEVYITQGVIDGDQLRYPVLPAASGGVSDSVYKAQIRYLLNDVTKISIPPEPLRVNELGDAEYRPEDLNEFGQLIMIDTFELNPIRAQDIIEYHMKEDWFFDKQRSVMDVRIIAIAPVRYLKEDSQIIGKREVFWVYFPEARYILQNFHTYNPKNGARRMSYDDLFWKRKFQSYVDKEDNVYGREIKDHLIGVDAQLQSDVIKQNIFQFEHDVWHF